jgi:hypothetical protein
MRKRRSLPMKLTEGRETHPLKPGSEPKTRSGMTTLFDEPMLASPTGFEPVLSP